MSFALLTAKKDLRRHMRDPVSLLLWLGIPLAIAGLIRLAFGGGGDGAGLRAHVLVVDLDQSFLSQFLLGAMGQQQGGELPFEAEAVDLEEGRRRIDDGDGSALLIIPEGFAEAVLEEQACTLELVKNPAQRILPGMVEEALTMLVDGVYYVHRTFGEPLRSILESEPADGAFTAPNAEVARISVEINEAIENIGELIFPPAIELVVEVPEEEDDGPGIDFGVLFFPSMLFMTLFFLAGGLTEDFWVERTQGTLRRALVTPNRAAAFLLGKLLAAVALIALVSAAAHVLGQLAFGLELQNVPLAILWSAVAGAFLVLVLLPIQLIASSQRAANLLGNLVMMPLLMLGGSFFPFEAMPDWMAAVGKRTPNGWALEQLKAITTGTYDVPSLAVAFGGLLAVCAVLFALCTWRLGGAFARSA